MSVEAYKIEESGLEMYIGTFENGAAAMAAVNSQVPGGVQIKFIAVEPADSGRRRVVDSWIAG